MDLKVCTFFMLLNSATKILRKRPDTDTRSFRADEAVPEGVGLDIGTNFSLVSGLWGI